MTVVIDASLLAETLLLSPVGERAASRLREAEGRLHLPHLADVETASVLQGLVLGGVVSEDRAAQALVDLRDFPARRWPATFLFERVWALRANVTAYDATYVALAEVLQAELLTADGRLARALDGVARCPVTLIGVDPTGPRPPKSSATPGDPRR